MASLDVYSLFTNVPLDETIDICIDSLYNDNEDTHKIPKYVFHNLLNVATKELIFMFNNKFYSFETKWFKDCPNGLKPVFYRWCYDIFVLFSSLYHTEKFKKYLSFKDPNINFSLKKKKWSSFILFRHQCFLWKRKICQKCLSEDDLKCC